MIFILILKFVVIATLSTNTYKLSLLLLINCLIIWKQWQKTKKGPDDKAKSVTGFLRVIRWLIKWLRVTSNGEIDAANDEDAPEGTIISDWIDNNTEGLIERLEPLYDGVKNRTVEWFEFIFDLLV